MNAALPPIHLPPCPTALAGEFGLLVAEADARQERVIETIAPGLIIMAVPLFAELPIERAIAIMWAQVFPLHHTAIHHWANRPHPSDATDGPPAARCRPDGAPGGAARQAPAGAGPAGAASPQNFPAGAGPAGAAHRAAERLAEARRLIDFAQQGRMQRAPETGGTVIPFPGR